LVAERRPVDPGLPPGAIEALARGEHGDPFAVHGRPASIELTLATLWPAWTP